MKTANFTLSPGTRRIFVSRIKSGLGAIWYVIPALWVTLALVVSFWPA